MPAPRYSKTLLSLLFTEFVDGEEDWPRYLYDDELINDRLGIKRVVPNNISRKNLPQSVKSQDVKSFEQFLEVVPTMTSKQMKESATTIGTSAQWAAWHTFAAKVISPKMNALIEEFMSEMQRHPVNLMELSKSDEWSKHWAGANSTYIANAVAMSLLGFERMMTNAGQSITNDLSSAVAYNYDRLRKCHMRLGKRLDVLMAELDRATAGKWLLV